MMNYGMTIFFEKSMNLKEDYYYYYYYYYHYHYYCHRYYHSLHNNLCL